MVRDKFIKIRATAEEKAAFADVAHRRGSDISGLVRSHLERLIKRDMREAAKRGAAE